MPARGGGRAGGKKKGLGKRPLRGTVSMNCVIILCGSLAPRQQQATRQQDKRILVPATAQKLRKMNHIVSIARLLAALLSVLVLPQQTVAFVGPSSSLSAPHRSHQHYNSNHKYVCAHQPRPLQAVATVDKTDEEWRQVLSPDAYRVLREEGTEPPNTSPLNDVKEDGVFRCAGCRSPLFVTSTKFDSGTGWPSFYAPIDGDAVELDVDYKLVLPRTEVHCRACGGHLGHVFADGPRPTGKRYCLNGVAMEFTNDITKEVMDRVEAAKEDISKQVQEPIMSVLPGAAFDGIVATLFISSFAKQSGDGHLLGLAGGIGGVFQFLPLLIGAYYAASSLQKLVGLAGLDDR